MNKIELLDELRKVDEVTLLELLGVCSDDLVDAFLDRIAENEGRLLQYIYGN